MPVAAAACLIVHYLEQVAQQDTPSSHLPETPLRTSASWTDGDRRLSRPLPDEFYTTSGSLTRSHADGKSDDDQRPFPDEFYTTSGSLTRSHEERESDDDQRLHYLEQVAQQDGDQRLSKKKKQTDVRAILIQHTVHLRSSL